MVVVSGLFLRVLSGGRGGLRAPPPTPPARHADGSRKASRARRGVVFRLSFVCRTELLSFIDTLILAHG